MPKFFWITLLTTLIVGCSHPHYTNPHILIETNFGDIEVELYPSKAPKTVQAFISYIDSGYYTHSSFYRVVKNEDMSGVNYGILQGGIWLTNDKQHQSVPGIIHETTKQTGLSHTNGTISLARTLPGTANTEFFFCVGDQTQFDFGNSGSADGQGFAAFGKVFKGMDIVRKIQAEPSTGESINEKVMINKIVRL
jgi:peptidyl-prolyl cis-trans isomerase A (cyclophilin A)